MTLDLYISNIRQHELWLKEIADESFNEAPALDVQPSRVSTSPTPRLADVVDGLEEVRSDALIERLPNYCFSTKQAD